MRALGISCYHRDAAAALVVDGTPVAAAREEHFSRELGDPSFPSQAIAFCLEAGGTNANALDHVVFYEKPMRRFERELVHQLAGFPRSAAAFAHGAFQWLGDRLWVKNRIGKELGLPFDRVLFTEHQHSLAANALYTSPFAEAAILTLDDVGEWTTSLIARGSTTGIEPLAEVPFPHSLGCVVAAVLQYLGFDPARDDALLPALARRGTPRFADTFRDWIQTTDAGFEVASAPFQFRLDATAAGTRPLHAAPLAEALGAPRFSGDPIEARHADVAASLQTVLAECARHMARRAHDATDATALCFAGRLARNAPLVAYLRAESPFADVFVPAEPCKAGGALGAALLASALAGQTPTSVPAYGEGLAPRPHGPAQPLADPIEELHRRLVAGERVAWVRDRQEFAAASSGNRVVLASPERHATPDALLAALQRTEDFLTCRRATRRGDGQRSRPADVNDVEVTAVDDPEFHALLGQVRDTTGSDELWLEDFALRGSPTVRTETEAVGAFYRSTLDALIVGDRLYLQPSRGA